MQRALAWVKVQTAKAFSVAPPRSQRALGSCPMLLPACLSPFGNLLVHLPCRQPATRLCCILRPRQQPDVTHVDTLREKKKKTKSCPKKNTKSFTRKMLHVPHGASQCKNGGGERLKEGKEDDGGGGGERRQIRQFVTLFLASRAFIVYLFVLAFFFAPAEVKAKEEEAAAAAGARASQLPHIIHTHTHTHTWFNNSTIAAAKFLFYLWQFLLSLTTKNQILKLCSLNNKTNTDNKVIKKRFVQAFLFFFYFFLFCYLCLRQLKNARAAYLNFAHN